MSTDKASGQPQTTIISPQLGSTPSDGVSRKSEDVSDRESPKYLPRVTASGLATRETERMEAVLGDAILRFLRIRKGPRGEQYDLDAVRITLKVGCIWSLTSVKVATQPSLWDSENIERYKELYIHPQWENRSVFDPAFRWTWREERAVRRKVDWKIMVSRGVPLTIRD